MWESAPIVHNEPDSGKPTSQDLGSRGAQVARPRELSMINLLTFRREILPRDLSSNKERRPDMGCLWFCELRQGRGPAVAIGIHDFLKHRLRFVEEWFYAPGGHASIGSP